MKNPIKEDPKPDLALLAGPLLRSGEVTDALIDALREDNSDKELTVADHGGYIRVEGPGGLVLNRATAELMLGRRFMMQELEIYMTGFSGKIYTTDRIRTLVFQTDSVSDEPYIGEKMSVSNEVSRPLKTWSHLANRRRRPTEYEAVSTNLLWSTSNPEAPWTMGNAITMSKWYKKYRNGSPLEIRGLGWLP